MSCTQFSKESTGSSATPFTYLRKALLLEEGAKGHAELRVNVHFRMLLGLAIFASAHSDVWLNSMPQGLFIGTKRSRTFSL